MQGIWCDYHQTQSVVRHDGAVSACVRTSVKSFDELIPEYRADIRSVIWFDVTMIRTCQPYLMACIRTIRPFWWQMSDKDQQWSELVRPIWSWVSEPSDHSDVTCQTSLMMMIRTIWSVLFRPIRMLCYPKVVRQRQTALRSHSGNSAKKDLQLLTTDISLMLMVLMLVANFARYCENNCSNYSCCSCS